jgi:hypothetical protein
MSRGVPFVISERPIDRASTRRDRKIKPVDLGQNQTATDTSGMMFAERHMLDPEFGNRVPPICSRLPSSNTGSIAD